jgi:hypothetical protein
MTCREDGCKRRTIPHCVYCEHHYRAILAAAFGTPREPAVVAREDPPSPSTSGGLSGRLGRHGHVGDTGAPATE